MNSVVSHSVLNASASVCMSALLVAIDGCCEKDILTALSYCPESGNFHWIRPPEMARRINVGDRAGTTNSKGYVVIKFGGSTYRAHRLAWFFAYGSWPSQQIDHINGVRNDNRIANLRDVSPRTNSQNRKRANANNSNGLLGVSKCTERGGFIAQIRRPDGRMKHIGRFDTPEQAHAAYLLTKKALHEGSTL